MREKVTNLASKANILNNLTENEFIMTNNKIVVKIIPTIKFKF